MGKFRKTEQRNALRLRLKDCQLTRQQTAKVKGGNGTDAIIPAEPASLIGEDYIEM